MKVYHKNKKSLIFNVDWYVNYSQVTIRWTFILGNFADKLFLYRIIKEYNVSIFIATSRFLDKRINVCQMMNIRIDVFRVHYGGLCLFQCQNGIKTVLFWVANVSWNWVFIWPSIKNCYIKKWKFLKHVWQKIEIGPIVRESRSKTVSQTTDIHKDAQTHITQRPTHLMNAVV